MKLKSILIILCLTALNSCSFFDGFDEVPMYLNVSDEVALETAPEQGENTNGIFGISAYADGFNIGVFELPTDIPVLDSDAETSISLIAVINNNGQSDNPIEYPFYEPIEFVQPFISGTSITVEPNFKYRDNLNFIYIEDFETPHMIIDNFDGSDTVVIQQVTDARNGSFSGAITTTSDNPFFEKATFGSFSSAAINNTFIYLEIDYKNEIPFRIGVLGIIGNQGQRVYKIQVSTSSEWNKLYLDLTPEILSNNFTSYKLLFSSLPGDTDFGTVQFDNIKLITF